MDSFTAHIIKDFATEGVTDDGKPNGHFFITKNQAKGVAQEVVQTHLKYSGKQLQDFITFNFDDAWLHYDVNDEGTIDTNWVGPMMRYMCRKVAKTLDLQ